MVLKQQVTLLVFSNKNNVENPIENDDVKSGLVMRSRELIMSAYLIHPFQDRQ